MTSGQAENTEWKNIEPEDDDLSFDTKSAGSEFLSVDGSSGYTAGSDFLSVCGEYDCILRSERTLSPVSCTESLLCGSDRWSDDVSTLCDELIQPDEDLSASAKIWCLKCTSDRQQKRARHFCQSCKPDCRYFCDKCLQSHEIWCSDHSTVSLSVSDESSLDRAPEPEDYDVPFETNSTESGFLSVTGSTGFTANSDSDVLSVRGGNSSTMRSDRELSPFSITGAEASCSSSLGDQHDGSDNISISSDENMSVSDRILCFNCIIDGQQLNATYFCQSCKPGISICHKCLQSHNRWCSDHNVVSLYLSDESVNASKTRQRTDDKKHMERKVDADLAEETVPSKKATLGNQGTQSKAEFRKKKTKSKSTEKVKATQKGKSTGKGNATQKRKMTGKGNATQRGKNTQQENSKQKKKISGKNIVVQREKATPLLAVKSTTDTHRYRNRNEPKPLPKRKEPKRT